MDVQLKLVEAFEPAMELADIVKGLNDRDLRVLYDHYYPPLPRRPMRKRISAYCRSMIKSPVTPHQRCDSPKPTESLDTTKATGIITLSGISEHFSLDGSTSG